MENALYLLGGVWIGGTIVMTRWARDEGYLKDGKFWVGFLACMAWPLYMVF